MAFIITYFFNIYDKRSFAFNLKKKFTWLISANRTKTFKEGNIHFIVISIYVSIAPNIYSGHNNP